MDKEPDLGECEDCGRHSNDDHKSNCKHFRSPRGHRMPDTREQFVLMANAYDRAFEKAILENRNLRIEINNLKQKLEVYRRQLSESKNIS